MSISKDVPVEITNEAKSKLKVVVFAKNDCAPESHYVAWQVLNVSPSTSEKFIYPAETSADARWSGKSLHPVQAEPGSTLEILHPEEDSTPVLQQGQ